MGKRSVAALLAPGPFVRIRLFFLSPDPDRPKNPDPIRKIRIGTSTSTVQVLQKYIVFSTLNTFLLSQAPQKPYQRISFRSL